MSVFMRAVVRKWTGPEFEALAAFVAGQSSYRVVGIDGRGWEEFEVRQGDTTVLAGDLWTGERAREELAELAEFLPALDGTDQARAVVQRQLAEADAVVGMQILMSAYDASVAAANAVIAFLEETPGAVLTQVDTVGWYDGPDPLLQEPE
jgi:hypothetical protein